VRDATWLRLLNANVPMIRAYMRRATRDPLVQEELVASVTAIAWVTRPRGSKPSSTAVKHWLVDCCRRARADWSQAERRARAPLSATHDAVATDADAEWWDVASIDDTIWDCLMAISPRQRLAVVSRVLLSVRTELVGSPSSQIWCTLNKTPLV
jgi:DNA-directed RNA polymerase specialized sigma24 family protein